MANLILSVDDSATMRRMVGRVVATLGFELLEASDGLRKLASPQLVLRATSSRFRHDAPHDHLVPSREAEGGEKKPGDVALRRTVHVALREAECDLRAYAFLRLEGKLAARLGYRLREEGQAEAHFPLGVLGPIAVERVEGALALRRRHAAAVVGNDHARRIRRLHKFDPDLARPGFDGILHDVEDVVAEGIVHDAAPDYAFLYLAIISGS